MNLTKAHEELTATTEAIVTSQDPIRAMLQCLNLIQVATNIMAYYMGEDW